MADQAVSVEENQPLYVGREPIFPKAVKGTFRTLKWWIMAVTLTIYYVTPWVRWDRGAFMTDQAVLVDLANRRFFFFWIEIWPQEFYYVIGLLVMAGIGLFLFTSTLGRVWCGYACPQTVWTDLYMYVERWVEGDRNNQIRLHRMKWTGRKLRLRMTKWSIWLLIAFLTGGAWIFYFADAPTLAVAFFTGEAAAVAYITVAILTGFTFVFGGFAREQVCIYMCPWPRIQAAMLDDQSLLVTYKDWRGEPRGKHRKAEGADQLGDCIDCNACVAVCPTGVDIREGQQLGCITCALCIDACDEMMAKVGKPRGLIDYCTIADAEIEKRNEKPWDAWRRIIRPRTLLYFGLWSAIGIAMVVMLFIRDTIDITVAKDRNPTFVTLSDGSIRNGYTLKLLNKNPEPRTFRISIKGPASVRLRLQNGDPSAVLVKTDQVRSVKAFITAPPNWRAGFGIEEERTELRFWLEDLSTRERTSVGSTFVAPE
ncbi:MAG: cytochrome c oxidase accessory protein CcoG [Pseudomonadota bacterium]